MKGSIFTILADMVEQQFGLATWESMLTATQSDGVYISTQTYDDHELSALAESLQTITKIPIEDIYRAFGEFTFPVLLESIPELVSTDISFKEFLLTVDRVIHVEVKKLHPDASLPDFLYHDEAEDELTICYSSNRKLCMFAEGLISGAAKHFKTSYILDHSQCMHDGYAYCLLQLKIQRQQQLAA